MSAIDCQTSFLAGSVCVSGGMSDIGTSATDGAFWHAPIEGVAALNVFSVSCSALPSCVALTGTNVLRSVDGGDRWFAGPAALVGDRRGAHGRDLCRRPVLRRRRRDRRSSPA